MSVTNQESWHLFIAPLYLVSKKDGKTTGSDFNADSLKKMIIKDSRFKLKEKRFGINSPGDYGVFQYFFKDVRKSIFWYEGMSDDIEDTIQFKLNVSDASYSANEEPEPIGQLLLRIIESSQGQMVFEDEVQLDLMDVDITIYKFNVGHVSFLCRYRHPYEGPKSEESFYQYVLMINDRLRRLYLPWLAQGVENVHIDDIEGRIEAQVAGNAPYHDIRISIGKSFSNKLFKEEEDVILEDYQACLQFEALNFETGNKPSLLEAVLGQMEKPSLNCSFELLDDNRMFTVAYILVDKLDSFLDVKPWGNLESLNLSQRWHRLLTVDSANRTMITSYEPLRFQTVRTCTYPRWIDPNDPENSSIFGCTRHSFIMLGSRRNYHFKKNLRNNFLHQYCEMARLVLAQSAVIQRFGMENYRLSGMVTRNESSEQNWIFDEAVFKEVSQFKQSYNDFINRLYFSDITSQMQGTELYRMLQSKLEVPTRLTELRDEINQLSNQLEMHQRQSQEKNITQLTRTTIMLGIMAFVAGVYGANFIAMDHGKMIVDFQAAMYFVLIWACVLFGAAAVTVISGIPFAIGNVFWRIIRKIKAK